MKELIISQKDIDKEGYYKEKNVEHE